jgi:hypothetical protein
MADAFSKKWNDYAANRVFIITCAQQAKTVGHFWEGKWQPIQNYQHS